MTELAKSFEPAAIEAKWAPLWAEPGRFAPQVLTYSVRGLAWDAIDPSLRAFERMPTG